MADLKKRRHAREWAVQLLFQLDLNPQVAPATAVATFWRQLTTRWHEDARQEAKKIALPENEPPAVDINKIAPPALRSFAEQLVLGVSDNLAAIDEKLANYTHNWPLHRMGTVDRNVLRLAIYEMFFANEAPVVVCINEAVDLAKYFSSAEAGRFVNGILDRAARDAPRDRRR